jgi:hypothetical protein
MSGPRVWVRGDEVRSTLREFLPTQNRGAERERVIAGDWPGIYDHGIFCGAVVDGALSLDHEAVDGGAGLNRRTQS